MAATLDRRRLLRWFLGTAIGSLLASIVYPVVRFLSPPQEAEPAAREVEAGPVNAPELIEKGFEIIRFGSEPVIVIRLADDDIRAFSATCTHLECIVTFQRSKQRIWCNCHNGVYDLNGRNVGGPPPRPLQRYEVHLVQQSGQPVPRIVVSKPS